MIANTLPSKQFRERKTIGIFQNWGLGDLVMTTPVMTELRRLHPNARIVLMVRGKAQGALMQGSTAVDEVLQVPPNADRRGLFSFFWSLRYYHFDAVYVATRITPLVPLLLRLVSGVGTIIGDSTRFRFLYTYHNTLDPRQHRVNRMLETLAMWTGELVGKPDFALPVADEMRRSAETRLAAVGLTGRRYFAFHPGSSRALGIEKRIPVDLVKGVIQALRKSEPDLGFVVMFGPDDVDLLPDFEPFPADVVPMVGSNLDETKFILSLAVGFFGSDSALGHIASSYGVPTVTAVGPTNPDETRPWGPHSKVVASLEPLACRPCWFTPLQGNCPYGRRCMTGISVTQIMNEISLHPRAEGLRLNPVTTAERQ